MQIPALATHTIERSVKAFVVADDSAIGATSLAGGKACSPDSARGLAPDERQCGRKQSTELPPAAPILSPRTLALPPAAVVSSSQPPTLERWDLSTQVDRRAYLPIGTRVFFRAEDCGRWTRELLHGTVVHDASTRANAHGAFYYRVLWLRGVEVLPNGFFRASLELHTLSSAPFWPQEIGIFPTQLSAFRAVVTAEAIARAKFRREYVSGRFVASAFPSALVLNEILDETDERLSAEFRVRLTKQDDSDFLDRVGRGAWDFRAWMHAIGREEQLKEEDAMARAALSTATITSIHDRHSHRDAVSARAAADMAALWQPAGRLRFFLIEQRELVFPDHVRTQHLATIMAQMLHVYIGFAWSRWRKFVHRSRRHERQQRRQHGATRIQHWIRRLTAQWASDAANARPLDASLLAMQLYQRRQVEAKKLYVFMSEQYREKQRHALARWASAVRLHDPAVRRRFEVHEQITWHPSFGMAALPKLPRVYAHKRSDGSVAIDDVKLYKQFRANHAGPTDLSYWIIRNRVLAGVYPIGKSFRDARRIVARADYTTSVLLQEISVYVCLAETSELEAFEREHVAPTLAPGTAAPTSVDRAPPVDRSGCSSSNTHSRPQVASQSTVSTHSGHSSSSSLQTPWMFERVVRSKYDTLQIELRAAVKMTLRQVQLAQAEVREHDATAAAIDDASMRETLANKLVLAQQSAEKAQRALETLTMALEFVHFPIPRDGVPETPALEAFLLRIEDALRAKRSIYVFSMNGHGRTGFVAALLLGRLYGISSLDALERAQRLHDCQWSMHSVPSTRATSSPKAAVQITAVQHLLAHWDAIYVPITRENSEHGVNAWRAQQRGLAVHPFMTKDGFMISEAPDASAASEQVREYKRLQRIAVRESGAAQLIRSRRHEAAARDDMASEDARSRAFEGFVLRRASLEIMELAMVGAATSALDDLVRAVEACAAHDDSDSVAAVVERLVREVEEASERHQLSSALSPPSSERERVRAEDSSGDRGVS